MNVKTATVLLVLAGLFALGLVPSRTLSAQTNGAHVSRFLQTGDVKMDDAEWKVVTVELGPGAVDPRSIHAGGGLVYVLKGTGVLQLDGKSSLALHPGVAAALNSEKHHVLRNTSETETLRILVVVHADPVRSVEKTSKKQSPRQGLGF